MSQVFKVLAQKLSAANNEANNAEKTGLLLQYFESSPFYAWTAWQYLSENSQPAVQDYLFSRLNGLGEDAIEKFLLQFCYLAVNKPGQVPEATVIKLCSKSFGIAIKAHWLFTALCQDHPKNKTLESLRERTRRAAVERNRGILSPNRSQPLSPPFSPGTSMMLSHMASAAPDARDPPAVTPPDHVVMSPQPSGLAAQCATSPDAAAAAAGDQSVAGSKKAAAGAALPLDLPCLPPRDSWSAPPTGLMGVGPPLAVRVPDTAAKACLSSNSSSHWPTARRKLDAGPPCGAGLEADGLQRNAPYGDGETVGSSAPCTDTSKQGPGPDDQGGPGGKKGTGKDADAGVTAAGAGGAGGGCAGGDGCSKGGGGREKQLFSGVGGAKAAAAAVGSAAAAAAAAVAAVTARIDVPERLKALRAELGEGEQVTLLLERSQQQGRAVVADEILSEDERPTSPLTRLKYDKFDATLDVVDMLCEASFSLASVPQAERTNALRWTLEDINTSIAALNCEGLAIWFPMGRACDRILRLTSNEAVVLTSREKAPFLLYIEVQEDQPEGVDPQYGNPVADNTGCVHPVAAGDAAASILGSGHKSAAGPGVSAGAGPGADGAAPHQPLAVEFGRRETYGIALMDLGAQHQQHFMRSSPARTAAPSLASSMMPTSSTVANTTVTAGIAASVNAAAGPSPLRNHAGPQQSSVLSGSVAGASGFGVATVQLQVAPESPRPDPRVPYPPTPASPTPIHLRPPSYVALLEEDAENRVAAAASCSAGAGALAAAPPAAPADGTAVPPPGLGPVVAGLGPQPVTPRAGTGTAGAAGCLTIPTRSASNSNIAAIAALAALAASNSSVGLDPEASQRSSEGGNSVGVAGAAASTTGRQPLTPRLAASNLPLPPRPPGAAPVGAISPIHAAKEAQVSVAAAAVTTTISPTRRLRGSLGQEEGSALAAAVMAAGAGAELGQLDALGGGPGGQRAAPEALVARGGAADHQQQLMPAAQMPAVRPAASDAVAVPTTVVVRCSAEGSGRPRSALARPLFDQPQQPQQQQLGPGPGPQGGLESRATTPVGGVSDSEAVGAASGEGGLMQAGGNVQRLHGAELAEAQEVLLAAGLLSPTTRVTPDPIFEGKLDSVMAALQGTAPLVRVQIRALQPSQLQQRQLPLPGIAPAALPALAKPPTVATGLGGGGALSAWLGQRGGEQDGSSGGGASDGASAARGSSPPPSLPLPFAAGSRPRADGAGAGPAAAAPVGAAAAAATGPAEKSKTMTLLSRLGLCRKPATDDDMFDHPGIAGLAGVSGPAGPSSGGGAGPPQGQGLPACLPSDAAAAAAAAAGAAAWRQGVPVAESRLVQVVFEVTQGINLAIPSPHGKGKHMRTPSHVAMEQLADKYKVNQLPPPYPSGPPYYPVSYNSTDVSAHSVQEWSSEEGDSSEGGATTARPARRGTTASNVGGKSPTCQHASMAKHVGNQAKRGDHHRHHHHHGVAVSVRSAAGGSLGGGGAGLEGAGSSSDERAAATSKAAAKTRQTASDGGAGVGLGPTFLNRIMSRGSSHQQQQPQGQAPEQGMGPPQASAAEAAGSVVGPFGLPAGPGTGPSPRGGSPVRGAAPQGPIAAAATAASSSIKRRWLGGGGGSGGCGGAGQAALDALGPSTGVPVGAASALPPTSQTLPASGPGAVGAGAAPAPGAAGVKVTDGRRERELLEERRREKANAVYGDPWAATVQCIKNESPYGRCKGWALRRVIVKSGDDCRQELLALQLVRTFGEIFREANLPLWVRYYEVLVTSNKTALIEMVPDTLSIHGIKARSPPGTTLSDHFFAKFGRPGTPDCIDAQRRFTESLAAYSLICYILQIKDRHNGNILMCRDGRIVHIDFGFLLSNSPGGVNFESAPFKLTREMLEVMDSNSDGKPSEMFDYFKVLMIQGFLAIRKNSDRILLLLKMMSKSGFPCFKAGERAIRNVEKRLQLSLTEVQCVPHVLHLIAESLDAWRTRQYDYYQRLLNGIL